MIYDILRLDTQAETLSLLTPVLRTFQRLAKVNWEGASERGITFSNVGKPKCRQAEPQ